MLMLNLLVMIEHLILVLVSRQQIGVALIADEESTWVGYAGSSRGAGHVLWLRLQIISRHCPLLLLS